MSGKIEVNVTGGGVQFGNAWFSHESITGYTSEQLNSGNCAITGREYMKWLSSAAPVVERQPAFINENVEFEKWWCRTPVLRKGRIQIAQEAWEARAALSAPPELSELQATIARMRQLLATRVEASRLDEANENIARLTAENERLKGGQGEAVYQVLDYAEGWKDVDLVSYTACSLDPEVYEVRVLYTSQPAPVAVVLPERLQEILTFLDGSGTLDGWSFGADHSSGRKFWWRTELRDCLKVTTRPSHANAPADSGTHPHNDGLDSYRGAK